MVVLLFVLLLLLSSSLSLQIVRRKRGILEKIDTNKEVDRNKTDDYL